MVARLVRYGPVRQKKTFLRSDWAFEYCPDSPRCLFTGEKTPGGTGTHTGHTGAHGGHTDHTSDEHLTTIPTHQRTHTHDRTTTETAADSTAAAPEYM